MAKKKKSEKKGFKLSKYIDPLYLRVFIGAIVLMSVISSTLIIVGQIKAGKIAEQEAQEIKDFQEGLNQAFNHLSLSSFIFPDEAGRGRNQIYLQREPRRYWTDEEVERYWIPIEETGLEDLTEENRSLLKEILSAEE